MSAPTCWANAARPAVVRDPPAGARAAGQHGGATGGGQPALDPLGQVEHDVRLAQAVGLHPGAGAAVAGSMTTTRPARLVPGHRDLGLLAQRPRVTAARPPGRERPAPAAWPGRSARRPAGRGRAGARAATSRCAGRSPVHRAGVDPEHDQPLLQLGDVVPAHQVAGGEEQAPVAQPPAGARPAPGPSAGPTTPSAIRPRCCWKARTGLLQVRRRRCLGGRRRGLGPAGAGRRGTDSARQRAQQQRATYRPRAPRRRRCGEGTRSPSITSGRRSSGADQPNSPQFSEDHRLGLGADDRLHQLAAGVHVHRRDRGDRRTGR